MSNSSLMSKLELQWAISYWHTKHWVISSHQSVLSMIKLKIIKTLRWLLWSKVLSTHGSELLIVLTESKTPWKTPKETTLITLEMQLFTLRKSETSSLTKLDCQQMNTLTLPRKSRTSTDYRKMMHTESRFQSSNQKDKLLELNCTYSESYFNFNAQFKVFLLYFNSFFYIFLIN